MTKHNCYDDEETRVEDVTAERRGRERTDLGLRLLALVERGYSICPPVNKPPAPASAFWVGKMFEPSNGFDGDTLEQAVAAAEEAER